MFLGFKNLLVGSLHSKPLHGLELTSFSTIPGNKCCHGNTFSVSGPKYKHFCGFFAFQTLHGLELISFSTIPGNKCCHGITFFLFLGSYKYFYGFYAFLTPAQMELRFSAVYGNYCHCNTFFLVLGYGYKQS